MKRGAMERRILSFRRSYSSEDEMEPDIRDSRTFGISGQNRDSQLEPTGLQPGSVTGPRLWWIVAMSVLCSTAAVTAAAFFCALLYPIVRELRAETVRGQDGTEQRILGFWSILALSVLVGCVCCFFSWILTTIDSDQSDLLFPMLIQDKSSDTSGHGFYLGYGVAVLNGIMGLLTVIWSLT